MINRTNNAVESYNCRFNRLFLKQPNTIKFNQIVMEELVRQAETLHNIRTGKKCETVRQKVFVSDIPEEYHSFKDYVDTQEQDFPPTLPFRFTLTSFLPDFGSGNAEPRSIQNKKTGSSSTTVVEVAVVAARRQLRRWRWWG